MPIYEYVCEDCGEKYEKLVRSNLATVELKCPRCGGSQARKAFSIFGARVAGGAASQGTVNNATACGPVG
jgi:putative FmdB family regulatory protein